MAKFSIEQALALAREHLQAGRIDEARTVCRIVLETEPAEAEAHRLSAVACRIRGDFAQAAEHLEQAARLVADDAGLWEEAGGMWEALSRWPAAEEAARKALALDAQRPETENLLAGALQAQGRLEEAEQAYRRALALDPNSDRFWSSLGVLLQRQGRLPEAEEAYRRSLAIRPLQAEALVNLGSLLRLLGRWEEAEACYLRSLEIQPLPAAYFNQGVLFQAQRKSDEAESAYRRTLELAPGHVKATYNLATVLHRPGRFAEAEEAYRRALELDPRYSPAANNLGKLLQESGRLEEAEQAFRQALRIAPDHAGAHSNLLVNEQCRPGVTAAALLESHVEWDRRHAARLTASAPAPGNRPDPQRRLRLGFVSPDFGRHPVGVFLVSVLEALRGGDAELVCYCDRADDDDLTPRIRAAADLWRPTWPLSDEALADQIRSDAVDVLFDLTGHMAGNRLPVFARRPAPVQIGWIGYPCGTGLAAMDYVLANHHQIPAGAERYYRERVLRMPEAHVCYAPAPWSPAVGPLPAASQGRVTFASFNNPAKIGPQVVSLWARVLRAVPGSRLLLKYFAFDDSSVSGRYSAMFAREGVEAERIEPAGWSPHEEFLDCCNRVDVALDTFPFSGGATTCDLLWMGVPVVTWPGETFAGRQSLSHLRTIGFEQTIAADPEEYVKIAVGLANDLARLAEIRAGLRQRVAESPLCDAPRFAQDLMRILRDVWGQWCRGA